MAKRKAALLVANAPLKWSPKLAAMASSAQLLLAADGGANHLARLGLRPTAVIGDLDSISTATRAWLGEDRMVHRPEQDRTDLDKALEYAFEQIGVTESVVLAALGGRTDHDLANLGLLARLAKGEHLVFQSEDERVLAVTDKTSLMAEPGETWSFWTFDPSVRVTVDGVRWPFENAEISAATTPSISNQSTGEKVHVNARGGSVIVFRRTNET
jgi:thiamine pyrophosphokinase